MMEKVREVFNRVKQVCLPKINRFMLTASTAAMMFAANPMYAFADGEGAFGKAEITSFLSTAVDTVFTLMSVGVGVMGAFQLVPGIIHFVQASQAGNGDQRKEAGNGIAAAVVLLLLAGMIFMLQDPVKNLLTAASA